MAIVFANPEGFVWGAIVHQDNFKVLVRLVETAFNTGCQVLGDLVNGDNNRNLFHLQSQRLKPLDGGNQLVWLLTVKLLQSSCQHRVVWIFVVRKEGLIALDTAFYEL